jgi:hypothetical protein
MISSFVGFGLHDSLERPNVQVTSSNNDQEISFRSRREIKNQSHLFRSKNVGNCDVPSYSTLENSTNAVYVSHDCDYRFTKLQLRNPDFLLCLKNFALLLSRSFNECRPQTGTFNKRLISCVASLLLYLYSIYTPFSNFSNK